MEYRLFLIFTGQWTWTQLWKKTTKWKSSVISFYLTHVRIRVSLVSCDGNGQVQKYRKKYNERKTESHMHLPREKHLKWFVNRWSDATLFLSYLFWPAAWLLTFRWWHVTLDTGSTSTPNYTLRTDRHMTSECVKVSNKIGWQLIWPTFQFSKLNAYFLCHFDAMRVCVSLSLTCLLARWLGARYNLLYLPTPTLFTLPVSECVCDECIFWHLYVKPTKIYHFSFVFSQFASICCCWIGLSFVLVRGVLVIPERDRLYIGNNPKMCVQHQAAPIMIPLIIHIPILVFFSCDPLQFYQSSSFFFFRKSCNWH